MIKSETLRQNYYPEVSRWILMSEVKVREGVVIMEAERRNRKSEKFKAATLPPLKAEDGGYEPRDAKQALQELEKQGNRFSPRTSRRSQSC